SGPPGAFISGAISLVPGAAFIAAHWVWTWPAARLTVLGCALVLKGAVCFLAPNVALRGRPGAPPTTAPSSARRGWCCSHSRHSWDTCCGEDSPITPIPRGVSFLDSPLPRRDKRVVPRLCTVQRRYSPPARR